MMREGGRPAERARSVGLDLLRVAACVAVVGLHSLQRDLLPALYAACGFAIPAFFMASGCVLLNRASLPPRYVLRKAAGMLRFVVAWSVLLTALGFLASLARPGEADLLQSALELPRKLCAGLLGRGEWLRFWYLAALMLVYCALPALRRIVKLRPAAIYVAWAAAAAACAAIQWASLLRGAPLQARLPQTLRLWTWVQYFLLGGCLGRAEREIARRIPARAHLLLLLGATALAVAWKCYAGPRMLRTDYAEFFYDDPLYMLWCALLLSGALRLPLRPRAAAFVEWAQPLGLGVYLLHFELLRLFAPLMPERTAAMALVYFLLVLIASFAFVGALAKFKPSRHLLRI